MTMTGTKLSDFSEEPNTVDLDAERQRELKTLNNVEKEVEKSLAQGDLAAARIMVQISQSRRKLLGLDRKPEKADGKNGDKMLAEVRAFFRNADGDDED
jgi:hypothetical protein